MDRFLIVAAVIATAASAGLRGQTGYGFSGTDVALNGKVIRAIGVDVVGSPRKDIVALSKIVFSGLVAQTQVLIKDLDGVVPTAVIMLANSSFGDRTTLDAADLDQDGDQDIVVSDGALFSNTVPRSVFVLKNNAGSFVATSYPVMFGRVPALADFDSDGDIDISLGSAILVNDGTAAFPTSVALTLSASARETIAGDFDGDGDVDVAYTLAESAPIPTSFAEVAKIWRNDGAMSFSLQPSVFISSTLFGRVAAGDVNGDGIDDIVYVSVGYTFGSQKEVRSLIGSASLTFSSTPAQTLISDYPIAEISLPDLTGDGAADLLMSPAGGTTNVFGVLTDFSPAPIMLRNNGTGVFSPIEGPLFPDAGLPMPLGYRGPFVTADMNADGDQDIVGLRHHAAAAKDVTIFENSGSSLSASVNPTITAPVSIVNTTIPGPQARFSFEVNSPFGSVESQVVTVQLSYSWTPTGTPLIPASFMIVPSANGLAIFNAPVGLASGTITATAGLPAGPTATQAVMFFAIGQFPVIAAIDGDLQTTRPNRRFARTLKVQTGTPNGGIVSGNTISFASVGPVPVTIVGSPVTTAAPFGIAEVTVYAGQSTGSAIVRATISAGPSAPNPTTVDFNLTIAGTPLLSLVSGVDQPVMLGDSIPPIALAIQNEAGVAQSGVPVQVTTTPPALLPSSVVLTSGALGNVIHTPATGTVAGAMLVRFTTADSLVDVPIFVRGLRIVQNSSGGLVTYTHERPQLPIILAVDAPLPAPGYVATPYGNLATTITMPGPNFYAFDGIGFVGNVDPSIATASNGVFSRFFALNTVYNLTIVAQVYAYDSDYDFPANLIISNPVIVNL